MITVTLHRIAFKDCWRDIKEIGLSLTDNRLDTRSRIVKGSMEN